MLDSLLPGAALLVTAWLFGGMLLFSAGFAAFVFKVLSAAEARFLIRKAFPPFYLFVVGSSAVAAALCWPVDRWSTLALGLISVTTVFARQVLMPAINAATDRGEKRRFAWMHGASVLLTLSHIVASAAVLIRLAR
ncbi:MAG: DUF4149 domain-containing protein [Rubrivivax sp.]|jgi:hypothetical protein